MTSVYMSNLGIFGMRAHRFEDGVGGVAHAGLDGQEAGRDKAALQFGSEETGHVFADARGGVGDGAEGAAFIGLIGFDDAGDFLRVHFDGGRADAVGGAKNGNGLAMRRVFGLVNVVEAPQRVGMETIEFNQDFVRHAAKGGRGADGGGQSNFAGSGDIAGLNDRPVNRPKKAVANGLGQLREVHVKEFGPSLVDALAQIGVVLIGRAEKDGVGARQRAIQGMAGGSAGDDADAKWLAGGCGFARRGRRWPWGFPWGRRRE